MAAWWELICHHTYSGTPGVVYDQSPGHGSHGEAIGVGAADFAEDGASPGSGAVRIRNDFHQIEVSEGPFWSPCDGLRAEVTVRLESQTAGLGLHASGKWRWLLSNPGCFQFAVIGQGMMASFAHGPGAATRDRIGTDETVQVPYDRWITLGFAHDGLTTLSLSIDGAIVARGRPQRPLAATTGGVVIGNTYSRNYPKYPVVGSIDEVKIWRLTPGRVTARFFNRPMDEATRRCWEEFLQWLQRWREANPDCAEELDRLITALAADVASRMAAATHDDRFAQVTRSYGALWRTGRMGSPEMAALLGEFAAELSEHGVDPRGDDRQRQLYQSDCYRRLVAEMPSLDCDPGFAAYLESLRSLAPRERG